MRLIASSGRVPGKEKDCFESGQKTFQADYSIVR